MSTRYRVRAEHLVGKIRERYGIKREEAERQVDNWISQDQTRLRTAF